MASRADEQNLNPPVSGRAGLRAAHRRLHSFRSAARRRTAARPRRKTPRDRRHRRFRLQVRRPGSDRAVRAAGRQHHGASGRLDRRDGGSPGSAAGRLHSAITPEGQPPAFLGKSGESASRWPGGVRPRYGPHQRRTLGGCRRARIHARLADRHPADAQSGFAARPGHSGQDRQAEPPPRQRGGVAQDGGGRRAAHPQERGAASAGRRQRGDGNRQELDRLRRLRRSGRNRRAAARQRHVVRTRERIPPKWSRPATKSP